MSVASPALHKLSTELLSLWVRFLGVYRQTMSHLSGRLNDERLERHIQFLTELELAAINAGDRAVSRRLELARLAAIRCRSPFQIERMERAKGLL